MAGIWVDLEEWLRSLDTPEAERESEEWAREARAQEEAMWEAHERSH